MCAMEKATLLTVCVTMMHVTCPAPHGTVGILTRQMSFFLTIITMPVAEDSIVSKTGTVPAATQ